MKTKRSFFKACFFGIFLVCALSAHAERVEVDGIYYKIEDNSTIAEVTFNGFEDDEDGWMYHTPDELYVGDVEIPETFVFNNTTYQVTSIGKDAFAGSKYMTSLNIPASISTFGSGVFSMCNALESISVNEGNPNFFSYGNILYEKNPNQIYFVPRNIQGDIDLYEGITSIPSSAFQNCLGITSIIIPDGVTTIADGAFNNCSNLEEITLSANLKSIGEYAFDKCTNLFSISIPESVESIKPCAFSSCSNLCIVLLHEGLKSIEKMAFYNCPNIVGIQLPSTLKSIGEKAFYGCYFLDIVQNNSSLDITEGSESYGHVAYYASQVIAGTTNCKNTQQTTSYYHQNGDKLTLYNAEGRRIMIFNANGQIIYNGVCSNNQQTFTVGRQHIFVTIK